MLDHDKKARFKQNFARSEYVFVERPPLVTTAARQLASENCSKLQHSRPGLNGSIAERHELLKIDQDGVTNIVIIN